LITNLLNLRIGFTLVEPSSVPAHRSWVPALQLRATADLFLKPKPMVGLDVEQFSRQEIHVPS
jgi:hypothetical protein